MREIANLVPYDVGVAMSMGLNHAQTDRIAHASGPMALSDAAMGAYHTHTDLGTAGNVAERPEQDTEAGIRGDSVG